MIENNYFYYLNKNEIDILDYLMFYSIIFIQKPNNLFIYIKNNIENNIFYENILNKKLWKNINIEFRRLKTEDIDIEILKELNIYGGIYIKKSILFLKNIKNFLIHDYLYYDELIIGIKKNNKIKRIEEIKNINENILNLKDNFIYNINDDNIYKNIKYDYNFNEYFNIIYNFYIININNKNEKNNKIIKNNLKESNITIFNLIIYYILGYKYYFDKKEINKDKLELIDIDKAYYINLNDSLKRNKNMIEILDNFKINYERYEGLNGKKINNIKNEYFILSESEKLDNLNNTNSEYAVLYSHLNLLDKINKIDIDDKYILILEDDLCLDFNNYWKKSLKNIIKEAPNDWEIIMLGYFTLNTIFEKDYRLWNNDWSALSYIIKKEKLNKIKENKIENKYKLYEDVNVADNYIFRLFKTYLYKYPYFTINNNNKSTFHNDHDHYQKIYKNINYIILNNLIDKYF